MGMGHRIHFMKMSPYSFSAPINLPGIREQAPRMKRTRQSSRYHIECSLAAGSGREEVLEGAFGQDLANKIESYKPELILISAGFDSRTNDPLGQFTLSDKIFSTSLPCSCEQQRNFVTVISSQYLKAAII